MKMPQTSMEDIRLPIGSKETQPENWGPSTGIGSESRFSRALVEQARCLGRIDVAVVDSTSDAHVLARPVPVDEVLTWVGTGTEPAGWHRLDLDLNQPRFALQASAWVEMKEVMSSWRSGFPIDSGWNW